MRDLAVLSGLWLSAVSPTPTTAQGSLVKKVIKAGAYNCTMALLNIARVI